MSKSRSGIFPQFDLGRGLHLLSAVINDGGDDDVLWFIVHLKAG